MSGLKVWDTPHPYDDVSTYRNFAGMPCHPEPDLCLFFVEVALRFGWRYRDNGRNSNGVNR